MHVLRMQCIMPIIFFQNLNIIVFENYKSNIKRETISQKQHLLTNAKL